MPLPPALLDALPSLACPRCGAALLAREDGAHCAGCRVRWPLVDGVLDFLADPVREAPDEEPRGR